MDDPLKGIGEGPINAYATILEKRRKVWQAGYEILGEDPNVYRADDFGATMRFADCGDRDSRYGWEIDHVIASCIGGSDELANLRPLHWRNNASLGGRIGNFLATAIRR